MKNVTLAIDEDLLTRARTLAEARHTTLNAMVRGLLADAVDRADRTARAKEGMRQLIEDAKAKDQGGGDPYVFNRRDAYDEREDRLLSRHEHPDLRGFGEGS